MPLISIIVPIYKVEKYLNECIESVLNQSFCDYELVLINDGSPDNCGRICDDYAQKDSRVKVIHKQNSGVSESRNVGIDNSCGQYLMFLDGDDFLMDRCLELVRDTIVSNENTDIFIGQSMVIYDDNTKNSCLKESFDAEVINRLEKVEILAYIFGSIKDIVWEVCRNIYRREVIVDNKLHFDKEFICAEDGDWHIKAMLASEKILAFKFPIINYRRRIGSVTLSKSSKRKVLSELQVYKKWFDYFDRCSFNEKYRKVITERFANLFVNQLGVVDFENKKEIITYIIQNKYILARVKGNKHKTSVLFCRLLGVRSGIWLLTNIRSIRNKVVNKERG